MMNKGQLAGLMKQAQQMQDNMRRVQEQLANTEVEGQAGAGLVKVVMTCKHDVKRVSIDPSLLADDKDMLEDLVAAAVNDAVRRVETTVQEKMAAVTAGLPLPPGMKLPVGSLLPASRSSWKRCAACQVSGPGRRREPPFTCYSTTGRERNGSPRRSAARCGRSGDAPDATASPRRSCARCAARQGVMRRCCAWWRLQRTCS